MTLDDQLRKILAPLDIQVARDGGRLTCPACLADTTYTCRGLCGPCFLFGDQACSSDYRTPEFPGEARRRT